jgi:hypothetical protein
METRDGFSPDHESDWGPEDGGDEVAVALRREEAKLGRSLRREEIERIRGLYAALNEEDPGPSAYTPTTHEPKRGMAGLVEAEQQMAKDRQGRQSLEDEERISEGEGDELADAIRKESERLGRRLRPEEIDAIRKELVPLDEEEGGDRG